MDWHYLFRGRFDRLLDEMDEVWRAEFAEGRKGIGSDINDGMRLVLEEPREGVSMRH